MKHFQNIASVFVFSFSVFACLILSGCGYIHDALREAKQASCINDESAICTRAADAISVQLATLGFDAPTCTSVTLKKKVTKSCWHATAKLSNGHTIQVVVRFEDKRSQNDLVYVDLAPQLLKDRVYKKFGQDFAESAEDEAAPAEDEMQEGDFEVEDFNFGS